MPKVKLHAFVMRGKNAGLMLFPHRHEDGKYVVSKTRFEKDYERVEAHEVLPMLEKGYGLRMSNAAEGITAPRLIVPESIFRPVKLS